MSKSAYPLKMPKSVKEAAARLATAAEFLRRRAAKAKPANLMRYLRGVPNVSPAKEDSL